MVYSFSEGDNFTVCAVHQEQAERGFTLNISVPVSTGKYIKVLNV